LTALDDIAAIVERVHEEGYVAGRGSLEQEYFGKSAAILTASLFAASLSAAAQGIRQHSIEASQFFAQKAKEFQDYATPATVQVVEPADASPAVAVGNPITARFTRQLDPATISDDSMWITPANGGNRLSATTTYDEAARTLALHVEHDLTPGVTYRVHVAAGVRAKGGQQMGSEYQWQFTVDPSAEPTPDPEP
jgi:hypothetical protein